MIKHVTRSDVGVSLHARTHPLFMLYSDGMCMPVSELVQSLFNSYCIVYPGIHMHVYLVDIFHNIILSGSSSSRRHAWLYTGRCVFKSYWKTSNSTGIRPCQSVRMATDFYCPVHSDILCLQGLTPTRQILDRCWFRSTWIPCSCE